MKNQVYIARNYRSKFDAAGKAKMDCESILQQNDWLNIGLAQTWIANSVLGTLISALGVTWALIKLKPKSNLCLQYPFNKFYRYCLWGAKLKKCVVTTIVHDVKSLKGKYGYSKEEVDLLIRSEHLIVHNKAMSDWFKAQGLKSQIIEIEAFDYLHTPKLDLPKTPTVFSKLRIVFAGNMNNFIYELDELKTDNFKFDLYGVGFKAEKVKSNQNSLLDYKGAFPADEIIDRIDGDFGLVWYGDSLDSCDGQMGQYLKFNNPHKLSLYILCEMPIIIWDKAAMADFVEEYKIGITVSSLKELSEKLRSISPSDYQQFKTNTLALKKQMQKGEFLSGALKKIEPRE